MERYFTGKMQHLKTHKGSKDIYLIHGICMEYNEIDRHKNSSVHTLSNEMIKKKNP